MTQPKANKVSEPGPSWEKEAHEAAEKNFSDRRGWPPSPMSWRDAQYGGEMRIFLAGARWAQEKGVMEMSPEERSDEKAAARSADAPGEESWEKIRDDLANEETLTSKLFEGDDGPAFKRGFDAAIEQVAKPLVAEVEHHKANISKLGALRLEDADLINSLRSEVASLREELSHRSDENLRNISATLSARNGECIALRAQLADLKREWELADHECTQLEKDLAEALKELERTSIRLGILTGRMRACNEETGRHELIDEAQAFVDEAKEALAKLRGEAPAVEGKDG